MSWLDNLQVPRVDLFIWTRKWRLIKHFTNVIVNESWLQARLVHVFFNVATGNILWWFNVSFLVLKNMQYSVTALSSICKHRSSKGKPVNHYSRPPENVNILLLRESKGQFMYFVTTISQPGCSNTCLVPFSSPSNKITIGNENVQLLHLGIILEPARVLKP